MAGFGPVLRLTGSNSKLGEGHMQYLSGHFFFDKRLGDTDTFKVLHLTSIVLFDMN